MDSTVFSHPFIHSSDLLFRSTFGNAKQAIFRRTIRNNPHRSCRFSPIPSPIFDRPAFQAQATFCKTKKITPSFLQKNIIFAQKFFLRS
jgi:hypothetical protein